MITVRNWMTGNRTTKGALENGEITLIKLAPEDLGDGTLRY